MAMDKMTLLIQDQISSWIIDSSITITKSHAVFLVEIDKISLKCSKPGRAKTTLKNENEMQSCKTYYITLKSVSKLEL